MFGNVLETVVSRTAFPAQRLRALLGTDTFAMLGYGPMGRGQALNLRDNGMSVIIGQREGGKGWEQAAADGFVAGKTLFPLDEAAARGTVIMNLLSDAGQREQWSQLLPHLTKGKTLYFSHGFSVVYKERTGVVPPPNIDVVLAAPKGSGTTVRRLFVEGRGINSSVAVFQDVSGNAWERAYAIGVAIGSGYLYETTFEKEVYSDLTGERGVLMGAIQGLFLAQYEVLRRNGHSPSEAFNETVEEATQSLYPLIGEKGMDWMYANCSTTAQRGALDWFPKFYKTNLPLFEQLYSEVKHGNETQRTLDANSRQTYREELAAELAELRSQEMWQVGKTVRELRPETTPKK